MRIKTVLKVIGICSLGLLIFVIVGCQTSPSPNKNTTALPNVLTVTNRYGLSLQDAQDKALKLEPGLTQDEVTLLLCKPDETSARTFGTETPKPWNGIVWIYHWGPGIRWFDRPNPHDTLTIVFEKGANAWVVNSWLWSGP